MNPFSSTKFLFFPDHVKALIREDWQNWLIPPIKADVDATNICNQNCIWCYVSDFRKRAPVSMSKQDMIRCLHELSKLGCKAVLFSGAGEPLCNDNVFPEAFYQAIDLNMKCALNTNGSLLDKYAKAVSETCVYVKVSIDAGCRETYQKLHGTDSWDIVWRNICHLKKRYKGMLGVDFLVHPGNYKEVFDFLILAHKTGASYAGVRAVLIPGFRLNDSIITDVKKQIDRFKILHRNFSVFSRMGRIVYEGFDKCYVTPLTVTIGADMNVYACCVTRGRKDLIFGNLREESLEDIWWGKKRKHIVESIDVSKCLPCKYKKANIILNEMKDASHIEFI